MNEFQKYCVILEEYYKNKYPLSIVEMASGVNFESKPNNTYYKTNWEINPNYNPSLYPNEGTYGYLFIDSSGEIVNMGETQNANSRPNNYNCVKFNKNYQPLGQKSNGSTNIGKNILMAAGLKENKNYKLILVAFGECVNQFGERMIAPSQEKTMSKLYTEITGKDKPLWNGHLKKLVTEYKEIFEYGQK